jgi:SAM-dependent methyltransferase
MDSIAKTSINNMKTSFHDFLSKAKKGDEIEIGFRQSEYKISLEKYIVLLKYLATIAKNNKLEIKRDDSLNVSYNYDYESFNNYRIAVKGIDNINMKMSNISHRENHVIFSMLLSQYAEGDKTIEVMEKIKDKKNMVDIDDYNLRIRLSTEKDIPKTSYKELLKLSEKERKYINFRYIQRVSLIIEDTADYTIRIDLSQVKSANKPSLIEKNPFTVELEFEVTVKNQIKKIDPIVNIVNEYILNVQKVLQKSSVVINKVSYNQVINNFKKLLFGEQETNIKDLPGMQTQAAEIPHIVDLIPNKYTITDKADGDRTFLFINDGNIYLLSNTLEIKQLNIEEIGGLKKSVLLEYSNTILDGEYIYIGEKQKFIFLTFDCLFYKGEDMRKEQKLELRLQKSQMCTRELFGQNSDNLQYVGDFDLKKIKKYHTDGIKKYMKELNEKLDSSKTGPNIIVSKYFIFPLGGHPCEVFNGASLIWNLYTKSSDLKCPYILDGIIFTPIDQIYTRNLRETKNRIYKWKPSSKNSLDFYIEYERDKLTNQILNVYDDSESNAELINKKTKDLEEEIVHEDLEKFKVKGSIYRILNLHVGKIDNGKEYPVLFQKEKDNYVSNIFVVDGEARDIEGNIIQDKTVVEFTYLNDPTIPSGFRWVPLRTRFDKTDSVNTFRRKYGNNSEIAEKTWRSMMDGVEISDIELLSNIESYESHNKKLKAKITSDVITMERRENIYYQVISNLAKPLREFHNWIKSNMIYTYCSKKSLSEKNSFRQMDILEIPCGKGGDLAKFYHSRVASYVGFDIDPNGIYSGSDGALSRYQDFKKKFPNWPKMNFLVADAGALLTVDDQIRALGPMSDQNKKMLLEIFDKEDYKKYDIINCQFAIHYLFKTDDTLKNFMENIKKFLKPSGYILITTLDASLIHKNFDDSGHIVSHYTTQEGEKKILFDVVRKYDPKLKDLNKTGISIDVHLPAFEDGVYMTEYLVNPDFLISTMKTNGFRLEDTDTFGNIYYKHKNFFDNSAKYEENQQNKKWYMKVKEFYNLDDSVNKACFAYSRLNRMYVFQKDDDGTIPLEDPKYKFTSQNKEKFQKKSYSYKKK